MDGAFSDCAIDLRIDDVIVGDRVRKGLGDIVALQVSMTRLGQLQPIGVTAGNVLVFGWRRLEAARAMAWETIRAVRLDSLTQAQQLAIAEQDENTCREPFTPLELLELSKRIDAALPAKKTGPKQPEELVPKFGTNSEPAPEAFEKPKKKRREQVAAAVGTSHENLRKIETVAKAADAEPEKFAPVVAEMERTGKVEPAYQAVRQAEPEADTGESLRTRILDRIGSELERLIRQLCDSEAGRNVDRAKAIECLGRLVAAVKGERKPLNLVTVEVLQFPQQLDRADCRAAMAKWLEYKRREKKRSYKTPATANQLLTLWARHGPAAFIWAVDRAIANTWQGLVEPEEKYGGAGKSRFGAGQSYDPSAGEASF